MNTLELTGEQLARLTNQAIGGYDAPLTCDEILEQMRTVLAPWGTEETLVWSARASGCEAFATGDTVMEAMQRAICLKHFGPTVDLPVTDCSDLF